MGYSGIDVRQNGDRLIFDSLQIANNVLLTTDTVTMALTRLASDGTLERYNFTSNTFFASGVSAGTLTANMSHQTMGDGASGTENTGIYTAVLATLSGFSVGDVCYAHVTNSTQGTTQVRKFIYGQSFDIFNAAPNVTTTSVAADAIEESSFDADAISARVFLQSAADKIWNSSDRTLTGNQQAQLLAIYQRTQTTPIELKEATADCIEIVRGDDYDGIQRPKIAIPLVSTVALTGASGRMTIRNLYTDALLIELALDSIVETDATTNTWTAYFVWSNAAASETTISEYKFDVELTINNSTRTLPRGTCTLIEDQSR